MPFVRSIFILLATHLLDVLFRRDFDYFSSEFRIVFDIIRQMRNDTSEGIIPFEKVIFDRDCYLFKDHALRIQYLKHFKHIDVLIEDALGDDSRNEQPLFDFSIQVFSHFTQLKISNNIPTETYRDIS